MVGPLTASHGNQPTKYSMSFNDAIANSKRRRRKRFDVRAYSDYLFSLSFSSHLSIYLYDEKKMLIGGSSYYIK
jgi:hypothetical protein